MRSSPTKRVCVWRPRVQCQLSRRAPAGRPRAASGCRTLGKKFTTTKFRKDRKQKVGPRRGYPGTLEQFTPS